MGDLICTGASRDPDVSAADWRVERFAAGDLLIGAHPCSGAGSGEMR